MTMRNPAGDSSQMVLSRVYQEDDDRLVPFEKTPCRIYVGKLDWYEYAVNEMFMIVLPTGLCEGEKALVFWKWTKVASGMKKVYVEAIDTQNADAAIGNQFHFIQNSYYTFKCNAVENSSVLKVTMKNPKGDSVDQKALQRQQIINKSNDNDSNRRKRALWDSTARVQNDINDVTMCTFSPRASTSGGKILAVGGFGISLAGLIPVVLGTGAFLTPFGRAVAIVGLGVAVSGVVDVAIAGDEPTVRPLFPNDDAKNTSSGGAFVSANNISILRVSVEDGNKLVGREGVAYNLKTDVDWRLSSSSTGLVWDNIFTISLPRKHHLDAYRALTIRHIEPSWGGDTPSDDKFKAMIKAMSEYALAIGTDGTNLKSYGLTIPSTGTVFRVALSKQFVVTQSLAQARAPTSPGDYKVLPLPNGNILVRIDECIVKVDGKARDGNRYSIESIDSEEKVKEHIMSNPEGWAYVWNYTTKDLTTWTKEDYADEIIVKTIYARVYFLVPGMRVTTYQMLVED